MSKEPVKAFTPKEIYISYFYLVLRIDPYIETILNSIIRHDGSIELYPSPPECFHIAIDECNYPPMYYWMGCYTDLELHAPKRIALYLNRLLTWHVNKGIRLLHTRDRVPIKTVEDIKKIWEALGIKSKGDKSINAYDKAKIENYLLPEHNENLKKLSRDGKGGKIAWYAWIYKKIEGLERFGKVISTFKWVAILIMLGIVSLLDWLFGWKIGEKLIDIYNRLPNLK